MRRWRLSGRGWAGLAAGLALGIAAVAAGLGRDPWPARVAIRPGPGAMDGFTRDGRGVVTTGPAGTTAWDLATGRPRPEGEVGLRRVTPAPDGWSVVGVMGDDRVRSDLVQVDLESGKVLARFPLGRDRVLAPTLAGTTLRAVVLAGNRTKAEVVTWELAAGTEARRAVFGPDGPGPRLAPQVGDTWTQPAPLAFAPDGRTWAYAQVNPVGIRLWDADADCAIGDLIPGPPGGVAAATFTPDGRALILGDGVGGFFVHDLAGPRPVRSIQADRGDLFQGSVAISPDGRTLAAGWMRPNTPTSAPARFLAAVRSLIPGWNQRRDLRVTLIDLPTGQTLAESPGSTDPEFAPDGWTLLTREPDGSIAIRDVPRPPTR